ncbi:hypothetical protein [Streptomyces ipomoeae]|uniref:hypothetical protein n=1 Tax=Streptomyces ipomoeae TaxID=103232 RepID=UPI0029AEE5E5|nr:hypothetical protein [Streptomyces ipomoeae]MDX2694903.1 hypothetical protein [Streptomyces ipomoeae]MDX2839346.1 hypothetical protein [Streptomyces ipomoeae]
MSPPSTTELAKVAYEAYGNSTGHKNYQGHPMPDWDELTASVRLAWIEAAGAVAIANLAELSGITRPSTDPSVGDVVLVPMDPATNNGATTAPAVITRVWSPSTVNVRVLADGESAPEWRTSLVYAESFEGLNGPFAAWTWPGDDD